MSIGRFNNLFKKATLFVAFFISLSAILVPAQTTGANLPARESHKEIIEKAHNLSLQKDRTQAINLLKLALKKETKKTVAQKELSQTLTDLTTMFFSEKAQQLFELGLSLKFTDPSMSAVKLQEAQKIEPDNLTIEMALDRLAISQNDCATVASRISKNKELTQYLEEYRLIYAQALVCSGKPAEYAAIKMLNDPKQLSLGPFWSVLELESLHKQGQYAKVIEVSNLGAVLIPEVFYWKWKAEVDSKQKAEKTAQKYLNLCKTINSRQSRELIYEPNLCRRTTEVETYLKKNNNADT